MDNYSFTLRNDSPELNGEKIGAFEAFFPDKDRLFKTVEKEDIPKYVRIKDAVFKTKHNGGNYSIFIAPGNMAPIPKAAPLKITYIEANKLDFLFYKIKKDQAQKWMFWALIAALGGVCIDASFAIGKVHTYIPCSQFQTIAMLSIAMILKIGGFLLAFIKGFWESK